MIEVTAPTSLQGDSLHAELVAAGLPVDEVVLVAGLLELHGLTEPHRTDAQTIVDAHVPPDPPPDPNEELRLAIEAATTLDELKAALLGTNRPGQVAGRAV